MNNLYAVVRLMVLISFCFCTHVYGQTDTTQRLPPQPIKQNSGFDVIIKKSGEIIYGLVTEVAPYLIYYKRTDIPDGPIYSVPRNDVYAISYRNQVIDYIHPFDENGEMPPPGGAMNPANGNNSNYPRINYNKNIVLDHGSVHIGVGFIRSFSKVDHANNYSSSGGAPVISLAYDAKIKDNLKVGVLIGFGSHKFSNQDYSTYDSTFNSLSLKESIFGLYAYGKYTLLNTTSRIQPYITLGLGIATSHITSENKISFLNDDTKVLLVKSGARGASLNLMARVGAEYYFSNQLQAFIDAGSGLSILNLGISVSVK